MLTVLAYANSFPGAFILDDLPIVQFNYHVHHPDVATIFQSDYWNAKNSGLFRPLTILSLALDYKLSGSAAVGFHLVNALLHAGVAILLWRVLMLWEMPAVACGVAALLFAVHPIHAEVVNVVVGRSELLVAVCLLSAFIVTRHTGVLPGVTVCVLYLLALLAKEHAIVFLALLPMRESFAAGAFRIWRQRWPLYAGLLLTTVLWLLWRAEGVVRTLPYYGPNNYAAPLAFVDTQTRILSALQFQGVYLWKLLVPTNLQLNYALSDLPALITSFASVRGALTITAAVALVVLVLRGWRRQQPFALFAGLYLVSFAPTSNLILPIGVTLADRLAYFPSLWFCAAFGYLTVSVLRHHAARCVAGVVIAMLLVLGGVTWWRNPVYDSNLSVWRAEVARNSQDYFAMTCLAESYAANGQYLAAEDTFRQLLAEAPDYRVGVNARSNFLLNAGRYREARDSALHSLALAASQQDQLGIAVAKIDLAKSYLGLGEFSRVLDILPPQDVVLKDQQIYFVLRGTALALLERDAEAVDCFSRIYIGFDRYLYGQSLFRLGRLAEARKQLELATKKNGSTGQAWHLLGMVSSQLGDMSSAQAAFEKAVELEPSNGDYRKNLERVNNFR